MKSASVSRTMRRAESWGDFDGGGVVSEERSEGGADVGDTISRMTVEVLRFVA